MALKRYRKWVDRNGKKKVVKASKPWIPRSIVSPKVFIKRVRFQETWIMGTATTGDFWRYYTWTTSNFNNFAELASVFDEYKVCALKYTFRPAYDGVDLSAVVAPQTYGATAYAHVCIDPSSNLIPSGTYTAANMNTFMENQGVRTYKLERPFSVYFKPKVSDQLFGGSTASRTVKSGYLKTGETAVQHRGFHIFLQQNSMNNINTAIKLDVFITAYCIFRNPR